MKIDSSLLAVSLGLCAVMAAATSGAADLPAPGKSRTVDVRSKMGAPTDIRVTDAGEEIWEYARRASPYETYIARFSRNGTLREINQVINDKTFSSIKVGRTTKTQVRELLGPPWRTVMFADDDDDEDTQEIWEYRGRDATGTYKFQIEFDHHGITRLADKIRDATGMKGPRRSK